MDCDFCAYIEISIQVQHENGFECGLCDYKADSLDTLDAHLKTCESYACYRCNIRVHHIIDIRKHIKEKHETEYVNITHAKLDRKDANFVKKKKQCKDKLFD